MDDESCFRVHCSAVRERELGLVQSLLPLVSRKIVAPGKIGKLLMAAGEGESADIIDLAISVCESIGRNERQRFNRPGKRCIMPH